MRARGALDHESCFSARPSPLVFVEAAILTEHEGTHEGETVCSVTVIENPKGETDE
jgi:hypothetical protein